MSAQQGHDAVVKLLVEHKSINVNLADEYGKTPLIQSAQNGHTRVVHLLLQHPDIDVNLQREGGATPLYSVVQKKVTVLLSTSLAWPAWAG